MTPSLTKGKQTLPLPPGFQLAHAGLTVLPLSSQLSSRLSRKLHDPKTMTHFCVRNVFHKHARSRNICPNPQRISEVKQVRLQRLSKQQSGHRESMASIIVSNEGNELGKPGRSMNRLPLPLRRPDACLYFNLDSLLHLGITNFEYAGNILFLLLLVISSPIITRLLEI